MKIYIFADMEGISGVSCRGHVLVSEPALYAVGRELMAADINACVEGCFRAGADEVIVRDGHGGGCNVDPGRIDSRARLIQGATPNVRFSGLDGADGLILLGYHAKAGTPGALLEHSYNSKAFQNMWLNGRKAGEIAIDAAIAAEHHVPVLLVTGDDKACAEALSWLPKVPVCRVKTSSGLEETELLPLEEAHQRITAAASEAVSRRRECALLEMPRPLTLRIEMMERLQRRIEGAVYPDSDDCRIYEKSGNSLERLFFELI